MFSIPGEGTFWNLVANDTHLFLGESLFDKVWRAELDGSNAEAIFSAGPGLALTSPSSVALTGSELVWLEIASRRPSNLVSVELDNPGSPTSFIGEEFGEARYLTSTDDYLFWFDQTNRSIYRSDHMGDSLTAIVDGTWARGMDADENHIYWANNLNLYRSNHNGNHQEIVLSADTLIGSIFVEVIPEPQLPLLLILGLSVAACGRRRANSISES